ncbi:hypothetical protein PG985_001672 [Apiospora marii]|uniref:uncharacterized protein n=1 Tax=Apiospora marii TaxID=335849 RepID=UPI00312E1A7D
MLNSALKTPSLKLKYGLEAQGASNKGYRERHDGSVGKYDDAESQYGAVSGEVVLIGEHWMLTATLRAFGKAPWWFGTWQVRSLQDAVSGLRVIHAIGELLLIELPYETVAAQEEDPEGTAPLE